MAKKISNARCKKGQCQLMWTWIHDKQIVMDSSCLLHFCLAMFCVLSLEGSKIWTTKQQKGCFRFCLGIKPMLLTFYRQAFVLFVMLLSWFQQPSLWFIKAFQRCYFQRAEATAVLWSNYQQLYRVLSCVVISPPQAMHSPRQRQVALEFTLPSFYL